MSQTAIDIKFVIVSTVTLTVAALSLNAVSQLVFSVLGVPPADTNWRYTVALFLNLVASAATLALSTLTAKNSLNSRIAIAISAATSGAWLGFYYGGISTDGKDPHVSSLAAVISVSLMAAISFYLRKRLTTIAVTIMGTAATYGLAFLCSAATFAFLSTDRLLRGFSWGSLCLGAIALTIVFLNLLLQEISSYLSSESDIRK
jgi:hypothetical membrane protein